MLWALAIWLAGERRRQTLRAVGIAFILVGALVLVLHRAAGNAVVESLSDVASSDAAIDNAWTIGTSQLTEIANAAVLYGVFIVIAAWLAGPTSLATSIREAIAPWYRQPRYAYGALAVGLILLFWWDPTEGTHRLVPSLVLIALLALGTEFLRRQVAREFPDRVTTGSPRGDRGDHRRRACARRASAWSARGARGEPRRARRRHTGRRARAAGEAARRRRPLGGGVRRREAADPLQRPLTTRRPRPRVTR